MSKKTPPGPPFINWPTTGFVRLRQILSVIPVGRSTWLNWCDSGIAPAPLKLSERITVWRVEEIDSFIAQRSKEEAGRS